jgi:hypothetical protein
LASGSGSDVRLPRHSFTIVATAGRGGETRRSPFPAKQSCAARSEGIIAGNTGPYLGCHRWCPSAQFMFLRSGWTIGAPRAPITFFPVEPSAPRSRQLSYLGPSLQTSEHGPRWWLWWRGRLTFTLSLADLSSRNRSAKSLKGKSANDFNRDKLICIQAPWACPDKVNPLQCGAAFVPKHRLISASSTPARSGLRINGAVWKTLGNCARV